MTIWINIEREDIFELNIVCKFHKVVIKTSQLKDKTLSKFGVISGTKSNNIGIWGDMDHYQT